MLMDVYYGSYDQHLEEGEERRPKVEPYRLKIIGRDEREAFRQTLEGYGMRCVDWNSRYAVVLVNTEFWNFGLIYLPVRHSGVNDHDPTLPCFLSREEFMERIFAPALERRRAAGLPCEGVPDDRQAVGRGVMPLPGESAAVNGSLDVTQPGALVSGPDGQRVFIPISEDEPNEQSKDD